MHPIKDGPYKELIQYLWERSDDELFAIFKRIMLDHNHPKSLPSEIAREIGHLGKISFHDIRRWSRWDFHHKTTVAMFNSDEPYPTELEYDPDSHYVTIEVGPTQPITVHDKPAYYTAPWRTLVLAIPGTGEFRTIFDVPIVGFCKTILEPKPDPEMGYLPGRFPLNVMRPPIKAFLDMDQRYMAVPYGLYYYQSTVKEYLKDNEVKEWIL